MKGKKVFSATMVLFLALLPACGGGGGSSSGAAKNNGAANVYVTDAPAYGYSNVLITLKDIWFHTSSTAGPNDAGWLKFPITPVTVDLLTLSNGSISSALWSNIQLPSASYQQIRLVLAGTTDTLTASASTQGLQYNNEVIIGSTVYPLRIPDAMHGIRLVGAFTVSTAKPLNLAIDFNAGDDIVDVQRNGQTDYYLKPRLAYCDLDNAGAIVGSIDVAAAAAASTGLFVFRAEQVNDASNPQYYVTKRVTAYDTTNNRFVLYPLAPGSYDVILRGVGYETVIVRNVTVTKGTTPALNPAVIPQVNMSARTDTDVSVTASGLSPTGAWLNFYQTLPGDAIPHEIRFRHLNPFTGGFTTLFLLSQGPLQVGTWVNNVTAVGLTQTTPIEGLGGYSVVLDAFNYNRGAVAIIAPSSGAYAVLTQPPFAGLGPNTAFSVSGAITLPNSLTGQLDSDEVLVSTGGLISTAVDAGTLMARGGLYTVSNLPGVFADTFYGVEAFGWSSTAPVAKTAISAPAVVDLRTGNATNVNLTMVPLF